MKTASVEEAVRVLRGKLGSGLRRSDVGLVRDEEDANNIVALMTVASAQAGA